MSQAAVSAGYEFAGGFPTPATVQRAYDEADFNRAVQAYRFFYPSVSIMATWKGNLRAGMVENKVFGLLEGTPTQYVFTANSDTPYAGLPLDLSGGPMVLEFPPGPLMSTMNDLNQRWTWDSRGRTRATAADMSRFPPAMTARFRRGAIPAARPRTGSWCCCARCPGAMTWPERRS
jgi:hypothetical protein